MAGKRLKAAPRWKTFEESATQASSKIFSNQTVKSNEKVMGTISQVLRQIDVKVGDDVFIDIECKDHTHPVDLPIVEQFAHKLKDENAKSGIIISNSGFTASALRTAEYYKIKPVALIDKGFGNTSKYFIKAPVLASAFYIDAISYGIETTGQDFNFSPLVWDMKIGDDSGRNIYELFRDHWNEGVIDITQEGSYQYSFQQVSIVDLKGNEITVDLSFRYVIRSDRRKGFAGAESARGFYDLNSGEFTTSESVVFEAIETGAISDWEEVKQDEAITGQPFQLAGIVPLPEEPPLSSYKSPFTGEMLDPEKVQNGIYI